MSRHPEEGTLHAYIDGELSPVESAELEAHVATCVQCAAALAEARGFVAAASRAINALDSAPVSAAPSAQARVIAPPPRAVKRPAYRVPFARAAALLLLAGGTAVVVTRSGTLDGESSSPVAAVAADGPTTEARAMVTEPSAMSQAAPASPPPPARDPATTRSAAGQGAAAQKTALSLRQSAAAANNAAFPSPPPAAATAPAARFEHAAEAAALSGGNPSSAINVTRLRTKEGVVLTLTDEPLRTSFAEETAAAAQRPSLGAAAQRSAPVANAFRWSSPAQGRMFTLVGPLPVAELEAASKRLSDLERLP